MMSFVSKIWVVKNEDKNQVINSCTEIDSNVTMNKLVDELIEAFIINQESEAVNVVKIKFANIYIYCKYIKYTTNDMAKVFADKGAYDIYVEETMRKIANALEFTSKPIADYIHSVYN